MAGIGKNRVFDCAGLSELQESAGQMLDTAAQVTGELSEEMQRLVSAAAKVPTEARYAELSEAAERLSGKLDETPYLTNSGLQRYYKNCRVKFRDMMHSLGKLLIRHP